MTMAPQVPNHFTLPASTSSDTVSVAPRNASLARSVRSNSQLRYLSKSIRLEENTNPHLARGVIWTMCLVLGMLATWAGFATVPEVVRASGQIAPSGFERDLHHPDGGTLTELQAGSGDRLDAGDPIARLDTALLEDDLARVEERARSLELRAERLRAYLDDRPADFARFGSASLTDIREASATLEAMQLDYADRHAVVLRQREQKDQDLTALLAERESAKRTHADLQELLTRQESLDAQGLVRFSDLVELRRNVVSAEGTLDVLEERIIQARTALREFDARLSSVGSGDRSQVLQQLSEIEASLADTALNAEKLRGQIARAQIVAPVAGRLKLRERLAPGSFVAPGTSFGQIVPDDVPLMAQVRVDPRDVGRIEVGSPVQVKIGAYDFVRFGAIPGSVSYISPGSFATPDGAPYFVAEITLEKDHLGSEPGLNAITSGMTVEASVINGERTLLGYLFKPVKLALDGAFHES
ncbi:HlyD family type I secretion periplasmic adaptor subunit [Palleronia sp. LCG004]|uniref:HlyD family type I secretion periplasmic adaptor subunit n=1 Tax=Palleronia sp. LCG004 TaxID=3079304 RepID=UPI002942F4F0|nr:HlyD family type I secretion periplasmic adaptor subunit [Palleronia sp. LCG004]WOI56219.1 HlyD family type I secretion periplasmic adaptor subunit [Palleronia sp. LCG004]